MDSKEMMKSVQQEMPAKRWEHTLGVIETSIKLAKRFGGDSSKAEIAAILHDVAKYWPTERQRQILVEQGDCDELLAFDKELWHAHVGAFVAAADYGVHDKEILDAIRFHTSGRASMTLLDKIVCLADYMEPGRDFPGVKQIRKLSEESLEKALAAGFDTTIQYLLDKGRRIFPLTITARNELIEELAKRSREDNG